MRILHSMHRIPDLVNDALRVPPRAEAPPHFPGAAFDVIGIAASAGGLSALLHIVRDLPMIFPAALVVVQHLDPRHRSLMAQILRRSARRAVKEAAEGDRLTPGTIFVAPPNWHLLVNRDARLTLSQSELVHFLRPSADLMLDSLAFSYRDRAVAVVLTGTGSDGAMGVRAIKKMGGTVIVQDKKSSEFFGMPGAAIETGDVDVILPLEEIPAALVALVSEKEAT